MEITNAIPEYRDTLMMSRPTAPPAREALAPRKPKMHPYLYAGISKADREKILPALAGHGEPLPIEVRVYPRGQRLAPEVIRKIVCAATGVKLAAIKGTCRKPAYCRARYLLAYFLRHVNHLSYTGIGQCLGGKHHTTILHALATIVEDARTNHALSRQFVEIQDRVEEELRRRR